MHEKLVHGLPEIDLSNRWIVVEFYRGFLGGFEIVLLLQHHLLGDSRLVSQLLLVLYVVRVHIYYKISNTQRHPTRFLDFVSSGRHGQVVSYDCTCPH